MKIINKSRKIISIGGMALLPGKTMELPKGVEKHPSILDYLKKGVVADVNAVTTSFVSADISDEERTKIAEEAVAKYKEELELQAKAKAALETEIKTVKGMRKEELMTKALGMGIEVLDSDTTDVLKDKIIKALGK